MNVADYRLDDDRAATGLEGLARQSAASCHAALLAARQAVLATRDPTGIHGVRVALRRLRAAIALFEPVLCDDVARALRGDAKQLADSCGPTRDLDVFLAGTLTRIEAKLAARPELAGDLRALRAAALRLRRARHDAVRDMLSSDVFAIFDVRLGGLRSAPPNEAPTSAAAAARPEPAAFARDTLRRRDRKLRRALDRLDDLDTDQRHKLRLRVKRQRYAASFLAGLFDREDANAYIRAATELQDALGLANDRIVASQVVADIRASARTTGRLDWIAGVVQGVLAAQAETHKADDRAVAKAARRFAKAPRFWRRERRDANGEGT